MRSLIALLFVLSSVPAAASDRHFSYTYETPVLPKGAAELEPWTTFRIQREDFYLRLDHRLEFEVGLHDRVQMAWYLNFTALSKVADGAFQNEFEWKGVSNEWKFKLTDRVADPLGVGAYFEWGVGPAEIEIEGKLLLDKQVGRFLFAANIVGELELELEGEVEGGEVEVEVEPEGKIQLNVGLAGLITDQVSLGVEIREDNIFAHGAFEHATIHAGPSVSFTQGRFFAVVSVLPQVVAFGPEVEGFRELHDHEQIEARVLLGFDL
jgi:hypothetical protein